jgi:tryptophan synthase alpha chain
MFLRAKLEHRAALIPYLTAGFPDPERFVDLALTILESGADALEIGIPFSDPLLDGPSIQRSQQIALEHGVSPATCLELAGVVHRRSDKPLLFMGAYNPILTYGPGPFCHDAAQSGIVAVIIPDLPIEEQGELALAARASGLHLIQLVAPTTSQERLEKISSNASGFIYCISVSGVTGPRADVSDTARPLVERIRRCSEIPIAVGFGIAGPAQVREISAFADGVIVGSALINVIAAANKETESRLVRHFVEGLREAL